MTAEAVQLALPLPPALSHDHREALRGMVGRDWRDDAACLGRTADDWFPVPSDGRTSARALAVCAGCPVMRSCLVVGLLGDEHGIWGGTTEETRDAIRDQLAAGTPVAVVLVERGGRAAA